MNIALYVFDEDLGTFLLGGYLGVGMIGYSICICSVFIGIAKSFSKKTIHIYTPNIKVQIFNILLKNSFIEL